MATVLHAVVDSIVDPERPVLGAYTLELTRQLIAVAPRDCVVTGVVSASPEPDYARLEAELPGLDVLFKSALARRELTTAWQHGLTAAPRGMVHAPTLLAPLRSHDRLHNLDEQTVVTVHDTALWTSPALLPKRDASWQTAMLKRVERYADAVVVTSHAAGQTLIERTRLGERVRVVPPAPLLDPATEDRSGAVVLLVGRDTDDAESLSARLADALDTEVVVERTDSGNGFAPSVAGARLLIHLGDGGTFPYAALHAMAGGTPVAIRDTPVALETVADAAELFDAADPDAVVEAAQRALARADELSVLGEDRARAYTWRSAAERVWQLHADL